MARKVDESELTPEQQEQRRKSKNRLFVLLVAVDVFLLIYFIYQIISAFNN